MSNNTTCIENYSKQLRKIRLLFLNDRSDESNSNSMSLSPESKTTELSTLLISRERDRTVELKMNDSAA